MTAHERFQKGDRVRLTDLARERHIRIILGRKGKEIHEGTVVGFGRDGQTVRVLADGKDPRYPESYYIGFWEKI